MQRRSVRAMILQRKSLYQVTQWAVVSSLVHSVVLRQVGIQEGEGRKVNLNALKVQVTVLGQKRGEERAGIRSGSADV